MMHVLAETAASRPSSNLSTRELRGLFDLKSEIERKGATRRGLWIAVGAYLAYSLTDYLFIADVARSTITGRFIVGLSALCIVEFLLRRKAIANTIDVASAISVSTGYLVWLIMAQMTEDRAAFSYYMVFGAIFMMSVNLFFRFRSSVAIASSAANMTIFIGALCVFAPMPLTHKLIMGAFCRRH